MKIADERETLGRAGAHVGVEELDTRSGALLLRTREGHGGVAEQRLRRRVDVVDGRVVDRHSNARVHEELGCVGPDREEQHLPQPFDELGCRIVVVGDVADHEELVAARARHRCVSAHRAAQPLRDLDEHIVGRLVPMCVVDEREVVEVERHRDERPAVGARSGAGSFGAVEQE
jgi:hypothetical protein